MSGLLLIYGGLFLECGLCAMLAALPALLHRGWRELW
jgi:hypothetical protein